MWKLLLIADRGSLMKGTRLVRTSRTKIRRKGAHATTASLRVRDPSSAPCVAFALYSSGTSPFRILAKTTMATMLQIEPMISGSSGPTKVAKINMGTRNDTMATMIMPIIPLKALKPFPIMNIRKKGSIAKISSSILAVSPESLTTSSPVILETVVVGTPTEPKAVGIELTTRQPTTTGMGSMPRAIRIPAGIATAVPNPAIPSMKWPKAHAIKRARTRWSVETLASIFLIFSIAPVSRLRL